MTGPALAVLALAALGLVVLAPAVATAQAPAGPQPAAEPPRTPWGDSDLGGVWDFRTITPLEQVEDLSLFDRCLGTLGLPIFPSAYNNNIQLFQTPDHVVMLIEMMNDVRFIPLDGGPHGEIRQWMGASRGRWEADTLIVETTNLAQPLVGGASRNARLVERFTRVSPGILEYRYTVDDPAVWTRPWTAVLTLRLSPDPLFEYACHEGNYGLPNMLAGARQEEASAAADGAR